MKLIALTPVFLSAALSISISTLLFAAPPAVPYTENFTTTADWSISSASLVAPALVGSGGPDGSSYVSRTASTAASPDGAPLVLFRAQSAWNSSGGAFQEDWIAGGLNHVTAYVRHDAPIGLKFFARFTLDAGGSGIVFETPSPVSASVNGAWTKLDFDISASSPNFIPEGAPSLFNSILSDVGRLQIGYSVPTGFGFNPTSYTYDLDAVSSSAVPEPASLFLVCSGVGMVLASRRRRAG